MSPTTGNLTSVPIGSPVPAGLVEVKRPLTKTEKSRGRINIFSRCGCGSGKLFKSCCYRFAALLLFAGLMLAGGLASAQSTFPITPLATNSVLTVAQVPNEIPPLSVSDFIGLGKTNGWGVAAGQFVGFVEGTTNAAMITVESGALVGEPPGNPHRTVGGFINVYLPVGGTNSNFGAGFGIAYFNGDAYSATLSARLGKQYSLPIIPIPVYAYVESGGGYDLGRCQAIAQAFAGALLPITISLKWDASVGAAAGTISDFNGNVLAFGGSVTYHF